MTLVFMCECVMAEGSLALCVPSGIKLTFNDSEKYFNDKDKKRAKSSRRRSFFKRCLVGDQAVPWLSSGEANVLCMPEFKVVGFASIRSHQLSSTWRTCNVHDVKSVNSEEDEYFSFSPHSQMALAIAKYVFDAFMIRLSVGFNCYRLFICIQPKEGLHLYYMCVLGRIDRHAFLLTVWNMLYEYVIYSSFTFGYVPEICTFSLIACCVSEDEGDECY